jgi:hypothetical protein
MIHVVVELVVSSVLPAVRHISATCAVRHQVLRLQHVLVVHRRLLLLLLCGV